MRTMFAVAALAALLLAVHPSFAVEVGDAGALDASATLLAPAPVTVAPSFAVEVGAWLRAGDPPNWQVLAALAWVVATALMKASSRLRANALVHVPLVGQLARAWTTPGTVARTAGPPPTSVLLLALLLPSIALAEPPRPASREALVALLNPTPTAPASERPSFVILDQPAPTMSDAERVAAIAAGVKAGLETAQAGVQSSPILQTWADTTAGKVVMGCIAGAIVVTSAAGSAAGVLATLR